MSETDPGIMLSALRRGADLGLDLDGQIRIERALDRRMAFQLHGHRDPARRSTPARGPWRMLSAVGAGAAAVAAAVALLVLPSPPPTAEASTPLVETAPSAVPAGAPRDALREELGAAADLDRAWSTPAFGGTAYLLRQGDDSWCLSAPDPLTAQPEVERGSTCTDAATFERFGISLTVGANYIAVLPEGARAPTLRHGQSVRPVTPSPSGVVVLERLRSPTTITRYDAAGKPRHDTIRSVEVRMTPCPDGTTHALAPGQPCPASPRP